MSTGLNIISTPWLNITYKYAAFIVVALSQFFNFSIVIISNVTTVFFISQQVGNILNSHVTYGVILPISSTHFLRCFKEYVQTEEQWLFHILAENTGTTQVSTRYLYDKTIGILWEDSRETDVSERILYYIAFFFNFSLQLNNQLLLSGCKTKTEFTDLISTLIWKLEQEIQHSPQCFYFKDRW